MARTVDFRHLRIAPEKLGSGGQATVYALTDAPDVVFKWFAAPESVEWEPLGRVIDAPLSWSPHERETMLRLAAWPTALVTRDRRPVGTLMPRMPETCRVDVRTPRGIARKDASVSQLMFPDTAARAVQDVAHCRSVDWKLRLLLRSAEFFDTLHRHGLRFGDVSSANWLFDTGTANPYFLDCDGIRSADEPALIQTPDWTTPTPLGGVAGDSYRLALGAYRLLGERHDNPTPQSVAEVSARVGSIPANELLFRASIAEPGAIRPLAWRNACWTSLSPAARSEHVRLLLTEGWARPFADFAEHAGPEFESARWDALEAQRLDAELVVLSRQPDADPDDVLTILERRNRPGLSRFHVDVDGEAAHQTKALTSRAADPARLADLVADGRHHTALAVAQTAQTGPSRVLDLAFRMRLAENPINPIRRRRDAKLETVEWAWPDDPAAQVVRVIIDGVNEVTIERGDDPQGSYTFAHQPNAKITLQVGGCPPGRTEPIFDTSVHTEEAA